MHGPPAVACRFNRSPQPALLLVFVGSLTVFMMGLLCFQTFAWPWIALVLLALSLNANAWSHWWKSPEGLLQWSGEQWHWTGWSLSPRCSVQWVYDFQTWGLVKIENENRQSQWLWLHQGSAGDETWQAIRRALLASRAQVHGSIQHNTTSAHHPTF